jgi:hypothetical protein
MNYFYNGTGWTDANGNPQTTTILSYLGRTVEVVGVLETEEERFSAFLQGLSPEDRQYFLELGAAREALQEFDFEAVLSALREMSSPGDKDLPYIVTILTSAITLLQAVSRIIDPRIEAKPAPFPRPVIEYRRPGD